MPTMSNQTSKEAAEKFSNFVKFEKRMRSVLNSVQSEPIKRQSARIQNQKDAKLTPDDHYNNLAASIDRRAVIVCGAGVSAQIAPDHTDVLIWSNFVKLFRRHVQLHLKKGDDYYKRWVEIQDLKEMSLSDIATSCQDDFNKGMSAAMMPVTDHALVQHMFRNVSPLPKHLSHSNHSLAEALRALSSPIFSTNYDTLLDQCLERLPINLLGEIIRHDKIGEMEKFLGSCIDDPENQFIYHLHGVYIEREGFTLSTKQYVSHTESFLTIMDYLLNVKSTQKYRSMVFVGVGDGLFDVHFLSLLKKLEIHVGLLHYWIVSNEVVAESQKKLNEKKLKNVIIIPCGGDSRTHLTPFLWKLAHDSGFKSIQTTILDSKCSKLTKHTIIFDPSIGQASTSSSEISIPNPSTPILPSETQVEVFDKTNIRGTLDNFHSHQQ